MNKTVYATRQPCKLRKRFGRLVTATKVYLVTAKNGATVRYVKCLCDCDMNVKEYRFDNLRTGKTKSCGCLRRELARKLNTTHGLSNSSTYRTWLDMRRRCDGRSSSASDRRNYHGKSISYDPRWERFENFVADMGERPAPHMTLDRVDNSKGYCKANCRWSDKTVQARNRGNNLRYDLDGKGKRTLAEWVEMAGASYPMVYQRIRRGWTPYQALFTRVYCKPEYLAAAA